MIDTHTHIYFAADYPDGGSVGAVDCALEAGVSHMVLPNIDLSSMEPLLELHHLRPDVTSVAVGMHPEEIDSDWRAKTDDVFARFEGESPVAVGEIGIDLYHDRTYRFEQMDAFGYQLDLAMSMRKPVIIHCREALDEVMEMIGSMGDGLPPLVFHSFTYGPAEAERVLRLPDTVIGINGVATFKNAPEVREAVALAGIGRIVLETDSPYLAPVPKRGRTNESSYLPYIRDKVAGICGVSAEEAEQATDATARKIFRLPT